MDFVRFAAPIRCEYRFTTNVCFQLHRNGIRQNANGNARMHAENAILPIAIYGMRLRFPLLWRNNGINNQNNFIILLCSLLFGIVWR